MLLYKMASQSDRLLPRPEISGTSKIKAVFQTDEFTATARTSFDPTANDVRLGKQHWAVVNKEGKKFSFQFPLSWPAITGPKWIRYYEHHAVAQFRGSLDPEMFEPVPNWANAAMRTVASFCRGIKYYSASQFTNPASSPISFQVDEDRPRVITYQDHGRLLYKMYLAKESGGDDFERFMDVVGPRGMGLIKGLTFRKLSAPSTNYSVRVGGKVEIRKRKKLLVIPQFRIGRLNLSPNQLSEGTFKTLALAFHIMTEDSHAVLIEEPEVCVHHGLLSSILELIKSYSSRKQMVISTHSDYVLDHVKPENVYTVALDRTKGTIVRHIPKAMKRREFAALKEYLSKHGNLGEYWREGGLSAVS